MRIWCVSIALAALAVSSGCSDDSGGDGSGAAGASGSGAAGSGASGATGGAASGGEGGDGGEPECEVDTRYDPEIAPLDFQNVVDNDLFPLVPGTVFVYEADEETIEITVTPDTKVILGVTCTVVHDQARIGAEVIEDTFDWYAQDNDGNVWYMGEDTKEYSNGQVVSTEGSWEAGVDGAKPGIVIPGMPVVGMKYRQEYYACHAEDMGEVLELDASVEVPFGSFTGCLKTKDTTPLEPDVLEEKYYCPGVGNVLSVDVESGDREELTSKTDP